MGDGVHLRLPEGLMTPAATRKSPELEPNDVLHHPTSSSGLCRHAWSIPLLGFATRWRAVMTTFFCPSCFAEIEQALQCCPFCSVDIAQWRAHPYSERLMHALGHPLADVRMISVEALGRLGESAAAMPLAQCALAHPVDVTQGIAIVNALARLRRDGSWEGAVRSLCDHPARAVARAAMELHALNNAATISASDPPDMDAQVRALIDDLSNHVKATEHIMALGARAIVSLCRYLREGAQIIPQGRLFAVSMLARLHAPMARKGLRDVLHDTRLRDLPINQREAEYQVKDAVIRHLITCDYPERLTDAAYATSEERLPSAVARAGQLGLSSLAPMLVAMLEDDVLERAAGCSLQTLGTQGQTAILCALPALFDDSESRARSRLTAIRALLLLHQLHSSLPSWAVRRAHADAHPGVRAVGALFAGQPNREIAAELVRGALSDCPALALACREQLAGRGLEFVVAALDTLNRNAEPDIYGNLHPLRSEAIRWLVSEILKASRTNACARKAVMTGMNHDLLSMGMMAAHIPAEEFLHDTRATGPCSGAPRSCPGKPEATG